MIGVFSFSFPWKKGMQAKFLIDYGETLVYRLSLYPSSAGRPFATTFSNIIRQCYKLDVYCLLDEGMEGACDLVAYSYEELKSITGEFSSENFIGNSHFGKLYKGKIQDALDVQEVMVKIWLDSPTPAGRPDLQQSRFKKEIKLLTNSDIRSHPNIIKLIGYCYENGHMGVVYKQQPLDTLLNMLFRDDFGWFARVKVAFSFALLLKQFHGKGLWLRNIDPAYLLVDQVSNPILFDFSTLVGGDFGTVPPDETIRTDYGCFNFHTVDPHIRMIGQWTVKADVFSYGVLLLNLFAKRIYDANVHECPVHPWAMQEYKKRKFGSLAHKSFEIDPLFDAKDGLKITKLAMECLQENAMVRPKMEDVMNRFKELNVVRRNSHILGLPEVGTSDAPVQGPKKKKYLHILSLLKQCKQ